MKKILIGLAVLFVVGVTVVVIAASMFVGSVIKEGVNTLGPEITQTELSVEGVSVSPFTGGGSIKGLLLGNPEGFDGEQAMSLEKLDVAVDLGTLFSGEAIRIKKIHLKAPSFAYEKSLRSSNIAEIQKNIEEFGAQFTAAEEGDPAIEQPASEETASTSEFPIKVIIDEVIVEGGTVGLTLAGQTISVPIPTIKLSEIGEAQGGIGPDEAALEILNALVRGIGQATANAGASIIKGGADGVKGVTDGIKGIFGGGE
ncbi:MAG: hypothetical protein ACPGN3_07500 [Opitutales bacterium]